MYSRRLFFACGSVARGCMGRNDDFGYRRGSLTLQWGRLSWDVMKVLLFVLPVVFVLAGCLNIRTKHLLGAEPVDLSVSIEEEGVCRDRG